MEFSKIYMVRDALKRVMDDVFHYEAYEKKNKYIVWQEETEANSHVADNKKDIQVLQGSIDYFTKEDVDENVDKIQVSLETMGISFRLNSVQHEEETGYIHFEWIWEVSIMCFALFISDWCSCCP